MIGVGEAFAPLTTDCIAIAATDDVWRPISPVPSDGAPLTRDILERSAPSGYTFTAGWRYLDAGGHLLGCVVRFDREANGLTTEKQLNPFTYCFVPKCSS